MVNTEDRGCTAREQRAREIAARIEGVLKQYNLHYTRALRYNSKGLAYILFTDVSIKVA